MSPLWLLLIVPLTALITFAVTAAFLTPDDKPKACGNCESRHIQGFNEGWQARNRELSPKVVT